MFDDDGWGRVEGFLNRHTLSGSLHDRNMCYDCVSALYTLNHFSSGQLVKRRAKYSIGLETAIF